MDYCEEKDEFQKDSNILYGTNINFDLKKCLEDGAEDSRTILDEVKNSATAAVSEAMQATATYCGEKWDAIKDAGIQAFQLSNEATGELWGSTISWLNK